jgi:hypothetical protein
MLTVQSVVTRLLPSPEPGRALAHAEWFTLARAAEVLMPACPVPLAPSEVADNVERFLATGRSRRAWRVRVLLHLVEQAPRRLGLAPFSELTRPQREQVVARFTEGDRLWKLCGKVRYLCYVGAYGDERAPRSLGLDWTPRRRPTPGLDGGGRVLPLARAKGEERLSA